MFDLIRTYQLNIMLCLSSVSMAMALLLLITKFLSKKRKWALINMELIATFLLAFDRAAYIYSGVGGPKGYIMVRVSNFIVFFLTSGIVMGFNIYLADLLTNEGQLAAVPRRLQIVGAIAALGMVLSVVAAFTGLYYSFDANNIYHRGPYFWISYVAPIVGPILQFTVIWQYKKKFSRIIFTALWLYLVVPIVCALIQFVAYGISIVNMAMVLVSIFLYVFAYLDVNEQALKAHEIEMERLQEDKKSMRRLFDQTATAFVAAMEKKDAFSQGHSAKAAEMAGRIAKAMGKTQDEIDEIYFAALLHNVGIMGVPDGLVENFDKLSPEQFEVFKQTPNISADILSNITEYPILTVAAKYCNENYDGTGFPEGLKEKEIPEVARIMAVVDRYDAMTTKTKYSEPLPEPMVREEFIQESGNRLDPELTNIMLDILDADSREEAVKNSRPGADVEKELVCGKYRDKISVGVLLDEMSTNISFMCEPQKKKEGDYSGPSIIVFDSYDRRIHDNYKSIDAYKYMEYAEVWFDGHSVSTDARNMEVKTETVEDNSEWPEGKYIIIATKYEDHVKINMTDGKKDMDVIIALPDSSKYASIALTGENCHITDITVEKNEEETKEGDIKRIAEVVSYIERMESDVPNVQIDRHRSAYADGMEITGDMKLSFHTMSLPASNLVWHCPYIVLYYSEDGKVGGPGYREYALIRINGEIDKTDLYARNSFSMKRESSFPGWNEWKAINKEGMECEVLFSVKGNTITTKTTNMGVAIQNSTVITDGGDKVYAAITGDMVAITDIRIK
ncbi:HD domain-containing phosphohydrolase [Butyrivibrio sp. VCB2006]|uniref:HD domain-containing phosphohydrolase n=1 Tax=Butyrivibrio sp. VCB2006 TaxID=1280679 RepID=UPI00049248F5|nr:HD domain-containing phosphohydrolase [Butyrivibrio sp. VCB2006]